jgi:hypothetical protein
MGLIDKLTTSKFGLGGKPGPNFENVSQKSTSDIQALTQGNKLASSQDLIKGRTYGTGANIVHVAPSSLDLNGVTPDQYINHLPK